MRHLTVQPRCGPAFVLERPCLRLPQRRCVSARAAQDSGHSDKQQGQEPSQFQNAWEEHLSTQDKQADKYLPPIVTGKAIVASRGKFFGRVAILILGAVLLGERVTGKGAVQQLEISATGVPLWEIEPVLGLAVLILVIAAFWPGSGWSGTKRHKPSPFERIQKLSGRFACLGLASTIAAEVVTGKGALTLLNVKTGVETVSEVEAIGAFIVLLLLTEDITKDKD